MGSLFTFNIYQTVENTEVLRELKHLKTFMANSIAELTVKIDALQAALDLKQEQIAAAIAALKELVITQGTEEERQILSDKIDALFADVQSTPTE